MNNTDLHTHPLKRCLATLGSPILSFYRFAVDPEIIRQEKLQGGKPLAWYEMYLVHSFLALVIIFAVAADVGIHWSIWVGLAGLIVTGPLLILEVYLFRWRSFSRETQGARAYFFAFLLLIVGYCVHLL